MCLAVAQVLLRHDDERHRCHDPARRGPPGDGLGINPEEGGDLSGGEQSLAAALHVLPFLTSVAESCPKSSRQVAVPGRTGSGDDQPGAGRAGHLPPRRPAVCGRRGRAPLIRTPRTLPRVLAPPEAVALLAALRTDRDQAIVEAMLLGGLRRCEVLGLRLADVHLADRPLFIAAGKGRARADRPGGGPVLHHSGPLPRPGAAGADPTGQVFVVLKGPRRGRPLSAAGLDEILDGARQRARLTQATGHMQDQA